MSEPLPRAGSVAEAGTWQGEPVDCVVLDYDQRRRRRIALAGSDGLAFLLDLAVAPRLRDGDGLVLDDERIVRVVAAAEALMEITTGDARHLARIAWHLGNRHLPTELRDGALRIRADHVIEDMVVRLGARVRRIDASFDPEPGSYAGHAHGHDGGDHHG